MLTPDGAKAVEGENVIPCPRLDFVPCLNERCEQGIELIPPLRKGRTDPTIEIMVGTKEMVASIVVDLEGRREPSAEVKITENDAI